MKVFVSQIYIEVDASYPFSHDFQKWISQELTKRIKPSAQFVERYSEDYNLIFNMSAKLNISAPEIRGPSVFRKTSDVEFTIFLPHEGRTHNEPSGYERPLEILFSCITSVLKSLGMDASEVVKDSPALIKQIISNPAMIRD